MGGWGLVGFAAIVDRAQTAEVTIADRYSSLSFSSALSLFSRLLWAGICSLSLTLRSLRCYMRCDAMRCDAMRCDAIRAYIYSVYNLCLENASVLLFPRRGERIHLKPGAVAGSDVAISRVADCVITVCDRVGALRVDHLKVGPARGPRPELRSKGSRCTDR